QLWAELGVEVHTNAAVARATEEGFVLKSAELIEGGVLVWAGGVKAPEVLARTRLAVGAQRPGQGRRVLASARPPRDLRRGRRGLGHRSGNGSGVAADGPGRAG